MTEKQPISFFDMLRYFVRGFETHACFIAFLAIIIGVVETFNLALLYPMLSEGFGVSTDSLPFSSLFNILGTLLPMGSPFVNYGLIFILMTIASLLLQLLYWMQSFSFQSEVVVKVKEDVFTKVKHNDYRFFVDTKQGDILTLFNGGPASILSVFNIIISLVVDLTIILFIVVMLVSISWQGFVLVVIGGGLFYWIINVIGKNVAEQLGKLQLASNQSEYQVINEFVNGAKAITASNTVRTWENRYQEALQLYWSKFPFSMFIQRVPMVLLNSLFYIAIGVIVLFLYIYTASDFMSVLPILGTFTASAFKILPKVTNFGEYKLQIIRAIPYMEATYELLTSSTYETQQDGMDEFVHLESDITMQNISFAYHQALIIKDISLTIQHRKTTAIVGPSGSGKSTLTNLLLRLYDPQSGSIIIHGKDLQEYAIGTYRDRIGYVSQDPFVFNASIKDNICFGIEYQDEEVIHAARLACAHDFISALPDGYNTIIGDQGMRLSGGEKQRVVIARAMVRKPDLLILDEATSSLDNISEQAVQAAIDSVSKECTTVIIAHRLSTIHNADCIYVLEYGKVIESGTHDELMGRNGAYAEMYALSQKVPTSMRNTDV